MRPMSMSASDARFASIGASVPESSADESIVRAFTGSDAAVLMPCVRSAAGVVAVSVLGGVTGFSSGAMPLVVVRGGVT